MHYLMPFFTPTSVFNTAATRWRACCVGMVVVVVGGEREMININSRADWRQHSSEVAHDDVSWATPTHRSRHEWKEERGEERKGDRKGRKETMPDVTARGRCEMSHHPTSPHPLFHHHVMDLKKNSTSKTVFTTQRTFGWVSSSFF